jgi:NAD(P)-dependent dehydrogenase (short-subunit alcohol dehydrogenase family)
MYGSDSSTLQLNPELAADGITANAIAPGPTETELFRANNPPGSEGEARYLRSVPMRRFAQPEEIVAAMHFLPARRPLSSQVRPCLWMEVQAWGVCRTRYPSSNGGIPESSDCDDHLEP